MQEYVSPRGTRSDRLAHYAWGIGTTFWVIALATAIPPAVRLHAAPTIVAAYHFNEASGATLTDVSGKNNHGTLVNGPVWITAGKYGGALTFDGLNDLVAIADAAALDLTTGMTIEAWVKPSSVSGWRTVVLKETAGNLAYALYANQSVQRPAVELRIGSKTHNVSGTNALSTATWTHLAATYDGATARLYINGTQVSSRAVTGNLLTSANPLRIGGNLVWGEYYRGQIDEVRIYDGPLTRAQIQADMNAPIAGAAPVDTVPPAVSITAPADGSVVSGSVIIAADASDNVGVASVHFLRDGVALGSPDTTPPYSISWNTSTSNNGNHLLAARAYDGAGNSTTFTVTVSVNNPPRLVITQPAANSTVSGTTVSIVYSTTGDASGVARAHFQLDGGPAVIDTTYDGTHQIFNVATGAHTLSGFLTRSDGSRISGSDANPVPFSTAPVTLGTLNGRTVVGDDSNAIVSWLTPRDAAYDLAMFTAWDFLLNRVPNDVNGLKAYLTNSYLISGTLQPSGWMHNPAHLNAAMIESALAYYAYAGDARVIQLARSMADYHLAHGLTPSGWAWAGVPYASGCGNCTEYNGAGTSDGAGHVEPDKIGEFGLGLLRLYLWTGDIRYRDVAIASANALAAHVRVGTPTSSPWPFRVHAQTNVPSEQYTANVIRPIALFDELIRLNLGNVTAYGAARATALDWLFAHPMQNNVWSNYFEDVAVQPNLNNYNQYIPLETAYYLMLHPETDPDWRIHVPALVQWVEAVFGTQQFGANAIKEQIVFPHAMGSHTARYGAVNALYYELTGDLSAREKAYRALNWATYMISTSPQGQIIDGPTVNNIWFTDGYADYIRHFMRAMGAVPEWAPHAASHMTRSTSVVTSITYAADEILYTAADPDGTEVLKTGFTPAEVAANDLVLPQRVDLAEPGWMYDAVTGILKVRHAGASSLRVSASSSGTDTTAPIITSVSVSSVTSDRASISWATNEFADSQVEYGLTSNYGSLSERDPSRVTSHSRVLSGLSPGTVYHYRALSRDAAGNLALSDDATFTTSVVDTTPPSVTVTAPAAGSTVSGSTVTVVADASDEGGIASVQFMVDGVNSGSADTVPPYSIAWDSTMVANGVHGISATAVDTAGHATTSAVVNVTVSNSALSVITFNDLPSASGPLNGQYPTGVVDWGSNAWWRSGPWGQFTTNSISFTSSVVSASFRFITPRRLVSLKAFNGGTTTSTVTLSCAGNPSKSTAVAPNQLVTITTAWTATCSVVTVGSSNGWDTNFDDIAYDPGP